MSRRARCRAMRRGRAPRASGDEPLPPLQDYLMCRRDPAQAIRFIQHLPPESATVAAMRADPRAHRAGPKPPAWIEIYHASDLDVLMSLWDLTAKANTSKGKAPTYPRPGEEHLVADTTDLPYPFHSAADLLEQCRKNELSVAEVMLGNELTMRDDD